MRIEIKHKEEPAFGYGDFWNQYCVILKNSANEKIMRPTVLKYTYDDNANPMVHHYVEIASNKINLEDSILNEINKENNAKETQT